MLAPRWQDHRRRLIATLLLVFALLLAWLRRRSQKRLSGPPHPAESNYDSREAALRAPPLEGASAAGPVARKDVGEAPTPVKPFAAFISHFKIEAAMEARYLTTELERELGRNVFLDRCVGAPRWLPSQWMAC